MSKSFKKIQQYRFEISRVKYDQNNMYNAIRRTFQDSSRWGHRVYQVNIYGLSEG